MSEWQPIETAPEGETILGLRANCEGCQPVICGELYDSRLSGGPALIDKWSGRWVRVTQWAPLPSGADFEMERLKKQFGLALEAIASIAEGEGTAQVIAQQALNAITLVGMAAIDLREAGEGLFPPPNNTGDRP